MKTQLFHSSEIKLAAELLRRGELVAFPTETVFGLGADALNLKAVSRIFAAKGRPSDNPLIVHLSEISQVNHVAQSIPHDAKLLMDRFWPGPLTIVLRKLSSIPDLVTAGLDTVAVRLPNHPIANELIRLAGVPIAAPSANRSGRPSATTWQAVLEDLNGRIEGIVCGEPTSFGLESTVVDTTVSPPRVLRPGGVSFEELQSVLPNMQPYSFPTGTSSREVQSSPGLRHKHYQPRAGIVLLPPICGPGAFVGPGQFVVTGQFNGPGPLVDHQSKESAIPFVSDKAWFIGLRSPSDSDRFERIRVCGSTQEYASNLFDYFRQADHAMVQVVYCETVSEFGIGVALMDRLRRASGQEPEADNRK